MYMSHKLDSKNMGSLSIATPRNSGRDHMAKEQIQHADLHFMQHMQYMQHLSVIRTPELALPNFSRTAAVSQHLSNVVPRREYEYEH